MELPLSFLVIYSVRWAIRVEIGNRKDSIPASPWKMCRVLIHTNINSNFQALKTQTFFQNYEQFLNTCFHFVGHKQFFCSIYFLFFQEQTMRFVPCSRVELLIVTLSVGEKEGLQPIIECPRNSHCYCSLLIFCVQFIIPNWCECTSYTKGGYRHMLGYYWKNFSFP